MKKKLLSVVLAAAMAATVLAGCGGSKTADTADTTADAAVSAEAEATEAEAEVSAEPEEAAADTEELEATTITVFAAASLSSVMDELIGIYNETQPNVEIVTNYDSSGTLLTQIEEGAACDVFFSAAQKQMNTLQDDDGLVVEGTRHNVVNNQVCVVTYTGSETTVTGLEDIANASSIALADGSVPVGKYTRQAMMAAGLIPEVEDASTVTTAEISEALGGVEINECGNVSKVAAAVVEGSNEVGTVYKSDTYGFEDQLEILQVVSYDLTGDVIYPVGQIANAEADELESAAALDFINFLISDTAKAVYEAHYFDTDVED